MDDWTLWLYENSTHVNHSYQSDWRWFTKSRRYCSTSWLIHSVCPSVCGWYAVDKFPTTPVNLWRSFMNWAANWGPQSLITFQGSPCLLHTWSLYMRAVPWAVSSMFVGMTIIILENRSTITRMALKPLDSGNSPMMSMEICSQGAFGISFGCNGLWAFSRWVFVRWQA